MSLDAPELESQDGRGLSIGLIAACYNRGLTDALLERARSVIGEAGAAIPVAERVPGSAELPVAASLLARRGGVDAIVVLGVVIAGDTDHHRVIADSTANALQLIAHDTGIPVINGIITAANGSQAEERATGRIDRGREFALGALHMARLRKQWTTTS